MLFHGVVFPYFSYPKRWDMCSMYFPINISVLLHLLCIRCISPALPTRHRFILQEFANCFQPRELMWKWWTTFSARGDSYQNWMGRISIEKGICKAFKNLMEKLGMDI